MFNYLLSAEFTQYFDVSEASGIIVVLGLSLLALSILGYIVMYILKKQFVMTYLKIDLGLVLTYALAIAIYYIVVDFKEGETYIQKYQLWLTIALIVLAIALIVIAVFLDNKKKGKSNSKSNSLSIAYAAICIALSFGLSYVRMFKAPYGGSITLASVVPLAIYSYIFGWKKGLICGLIYGFLQSVQDPWIVHPIQYLLDYPIAFGCIGAFGGLFNNSIKVIKNSYVKNIISLSLGLIVGYLCRYIAHALSGAIFFAEYMPETFTNVWVYTFTYNALYIFPDMAISIIGGALLMSSRVFRNQIVNVRNKLKNNLLRIEKEQSSTDNLLYSEVKEDNDSLSK